MSLDEDWQAIERFIAVEKGNLTKVQAEELRSLIRKMLTSKDGRERISNRLESKEPFKGKERFLRELPRALQVSDGESLSHQLIDCREIILVGIEKSSPKADTGHWDFLWLFHQVDGLIAPGKILTAFQKLAGKRGDLRTTLRDLDSWKRFSTEGGLALLNAAIRKCENSEQREQLENARSWLISKTATTQQEKSRQDSTSIQLSRHQELALEPVVEGPRSDSEVVNKANESPVVESPNESTLAAGTVDGCILEVNRVIQLYWERLISSKQVISQDSHLKQEVEAVRRENTLLTNELNKVQSDLQIEREHCGDLFKQVAELEKQISSRERELAAAQGEIEKTFKECREAQRDAQLARDRAEEYIHAANLQREDALRTFQSKLWDRLSLHFAEVLEGEKDDPSLNEDQLFFRRRLSEIQDSLRELHVPPY